MAFGVLDGTNAPAGVGYLNVSNIEQRRSDFFRKMLAMAVRCEECDRLWSEHSKTTFQHIRVENELKLAVLERKHGIEWLAQATGVALRLEAIHKHKALHPEAILD